MKTILAKLSRTRLNRDSSRPRLRGGFTQSLASLVLTASLLVGGNAKAVTTGPAVRVETSAYTRIDGKVIAAKTLVHGGVLDFGPLPQNAVAGDSGNANQLSMTFTVKNAGTSGSSLGLNAVTGHAIPVYVFGGNAADFVVDASTLTSPLGLTDSTTFTVTYNPGPGASKRSTILHVRSTDASRPDYQLSLTASTVAPVNPTIALQTATGAPLTSIAYGNAVYLSSSPEDSGSTTKTVFVKNVGNSLTNDLVLSAETLATGNTADFTIDTTGMSTTLGAGESTSFTVTFKPKATGSRFTALRVASNDTTSKIGTTGITLNGTGVAPATFSFGAPAYTVIQGTRSISFTVQRSSATVDQTVDLVTDDGTTSEFPIFAAAVGGTDYTDLTHTDAELGVLDGVTLSFPAGMISKTVTVTLAPKTGTQPNKRFTATISNPNQNGSIGSTPTTTLNIVALDVTKPVVTVTNPPAPVSPATTSPDVNGAVSSMVTVAGVVTDARGITKVVTIINGKTANATLDTTFVPTTAPKGSEIPFSLTFQAILGVNKVSVMAYDLKGNVSTIVNRTFTLTGGVALKVIRSVPSTTTGKPDTAGTVALTVQTGSANAPGPAGVNPQNGLATSGAHLTLTATAKIGFIFSGWSNLPAEANIIGNVATFVMPSSALEVTAIFVATSSTAFKGEAGSSTSFYGLVGRNSVPYSASSEGFVYGTLSEATGDFTGTLQIDGSSIKFKAKFYAGGDSIFVVEHPAVLHPTTHAVISAAYVDTFNTLTVGGRTLSLTLADNNTIQVTTSTIADTSVGEMKRGYFSATRKPVSTVSVQNLLAVGTTVRTFTVALPAADNTSLFTGLPEGVLATTKYPQGEGVANLTLDSLGNVRLYGTLADGTVFSGSSAIVAYNTNSRVATCPIFAQLITPGNSASLGGAVGGTITFDYSLTNSDISASLAWYRPLVDATYVTDHHSTMPKEYAAGWPAGIALDLVGASYNATSTINTTLGLGAANLTTGNAQIVFTDGKLAGAIVTDTMNITDPTISTTNPTTHVTTTTNAKNVINVIGSPAPMTMTYTSISGLFSGTFKPNWTPAPTSSSQWPRFQGVMLQKGSNAQGFGFFISNKPSDTAGESGGLTLSAYVAPGV